MAQVYHRVRQLLETQMSGLYSFKAKQYAPELVLPGESSLNGQSQLMDFPVE